MAEKTVVVSQQYLKPIKILKWKVKQGFSVSIGSLVLLYDFEKVEKKQHRKLKSPQAGTICKLIAQEGAIIQPGGPLFELAACIHSTVMKDMCAECGADLRKDDINSTASVPMIHSVPELKVSEELAQKIGKADGERLLRDKKLVLLVDLDQTLIHTTNDIIPPNLKDIHHFQLYGPNSPWYHTRLRPGTHQFLTNVSPYFELHICTFGARNYAHKITTILDSSGQFFSNRVLSRDECFNPTSKTANLKALFPCGDHMVCIIDDREDVWSHASNLIHVKPYHFFKHTGDINAPPGLEKDENDEKEGVDLSKGKNIFAVEEEKTDHKNNGTVKISNESKQVVDAENVTILVEKADKNTNTLINKNENSREVEVEDTAIRENDGNDANLSEECLNNKQPDVVMDAREENGVANNVNGKIETDVVDTDITTAVENTEVEVNLENKVDKAEARNEDMEIENTKEVEEQKLKEDELNEQESTPKEVNSEPEVVKDLNQKDEHNPTSDTKDEEESNDTNEQPKDINEPPLPKPHEIIEQHLQANENIFNIFEIEDSDDYLLYLEDILKRIHKAFYDEYDKMESGEVPDLKKVIPNVKGNVLNGCKMIFSGLVPTHIKLQHSRAYQVAKSLGAKVTQEFEIDSTHLVAVRPGTAKVNAGRRRKNLKIVTPDWLWACAERWEHVDENIFPLNSKGSKNRHPPPHCSSPEHVPTYAVHDTPAVRKRTPSGRFMDTINPLMSFSSADIADMDKEVEDILDAESESENEEENPSEVIDITDTVTIEKEESSSSSGESLTAEMPRGHKRNLEKRQQEDEEGEEDTKDSDEFPSTKFRRGEQLDSDLDIGQDSNSEGSVEPPDEIDDGEWNMMGAALEREFLSNN